MVACISDKLHTENNGSFVIYQKFFHSETHYVSARTGPSSGVFLACMINCILFHFSVIIYIAAKNDNTYIKWIIRDCLPFNFLSIQLKLKDIYYLWCYMYACTYIN